MRKYEEAGGVVPMAWKRGYPWNVTAELNNGREVLAEVWDSQVTFEGRSICVSARIVRVTWDSSIGTLFGGEKLGTREVRRWCSLGTTITHIPLNLSVWPEAKP